MQTANIPAADLLYVNYNNLVEGLLPYSVVLDAARRCVVVAIRGSLSVEDCVTGVGGQWVGDKAAWTISVSLGDCVIGVGAGAGMQGRGPLQMCRGQQNECWRLCHRCWGRRRGPAGLQA